MHSQVLVLKDSLTRESGSKVHHANIQASKAVADIIRTTLGPRSMLKMLLDASGGIVVTNDGNAILRELDLAHPAAKSMIELSRTQDEEVGDGTTSVIVLAGEMLHVAEAFLNKSYHPTVICRAYNKALEDAITVLDKIAVDIDVNDRPGDLLGLMENTARQTSETDRQILGEAYVVILSYRSFQAKRGLEILLQTKKEIRGRIKGVMIRSNPGKMMKEPIIISPCRSGQASVEMLKDSCRTGSHVGPIIVAEKIPRGPTRALFVFELDEGVPKMMTSLPIGRSMYGRENPLNCQVSSKRPRDGDMLGGGFNHVRLHGEGIPTDPKATIVARAWNGYMRRQMIQKEFEGAVA
ncbi:hypothetical protein MRB53_032523 [Persea americana]|uniref:Uncharacterized protein n=1 Tax=Persea americana TaxID=3435 RepID=A0ACC2KSR7_PERAE|nr:hypothetical protein MRB53_032523 [Persea americana]